MNEIAEKTATRLPLTFLGSTEPGALVPVASGADLASIKRELAAMVTELRLQQRDLQRALAGSWEVVSRGSLQKARAFVQRHGLERGDAVVLVLAGSFLSGIAGATAAAFSGVDAVGWTVGLTGAAMACGAWPLARLTNFLAGRQAAAAHKAMVELPRLREPLARLQASQGAAKVHVADGLDDLRTKLDQRKLLSPEALAALRAGAAEATPLRSEHGKRTRVFATLARLIAEPLTQSSIRAASDALDALSPAERPVAAAALLDLAFADRGRIASTDYADRNRLHDLLTTAAGGAGTETSRGDVAV